VRGSGEVWAPGGMLALLECMANPAWAAMLGGGGRFLKPRNKEDSGERKGFFCRRSDMLLCVASNLH